MISIRIPKQNWGKTWKALTEVAPVRLIADDPIYEVLPEHLTVLDSHRLPCEIVLAARFSKQGR